LDVPIEKYSLGAGWGGRVLPVKMLTRGGGRLVLMPVAGAVSSLKMSEGDATQQR